MSLKNAARKTLGGGVENTCGCGLGLKKHAKLTLKKN